MAKKLTIQDKYKNNYFGSDDMELLYEVYPDPWRLNVDGHQRYHRILKEIDLRFRKENPKVIGEIGCSEGIFTAMLLNHYSEVKVHGCDISKTAIERCKQRSLDRAVFNVLDIGKEPLPGNDKFDVVILGDVLYYLRNNQEVEFFIKELERTLSDTGIIIITEFLRTKKYSNMIGMKFKKLLEVRENVHFDISPMEGARDVTKSYRLLVYGGKDGKIQL